MFLPKCHEKFANSKADLVGHERRQYAKCPGKQGAVDDHLLATASVHQVTPWERCYDDT